MLETLEGLEAGTIHPVPQDDAGASLAPILEREDALVDFARSAGEIYNRWRGFQPWPGAYTFFRGKKADPASLDAGWIHADAPPGELMVEGDRLFVAAGSATRLELLEVQLEGKKRMPVADFLRGTAPHPHERLGRRLASRISPARKAAFELLLELRRKPESHSDLLLRSKRSGSALRAGQESGHHPGDGSPALATGVAAAYP